MEEEITPTPYDDMVKEEETSSYERAYEELYTVYENQQNFFTNQKKALNTTTLLTTLALTDENKSIPEQLSIAAIQESRALLESGQERAIRSGLAQKRAESEATALNRLRGDMVGVRAPEGALQAIDAAYSNVLNEGYARRERLAIETEALNRIRSMAATNPVQAKVLLDMLDKGDSIKTVNDFQKKMMILRQRAEALDEKYQQSGWGRFVLNLVTGLLPTNFNFQRTGIVGTATFGDLFAVGNTQAKESEMMWNGASAEEFAEYIDTKIIPSVLDNATSPFDLFDDPGAAVQIFNDLIDATDSDRKWNNIWGGVEVATAIPWAKVGSMSRLLVASGDANSATRNLNNAAHILDTEGVEAMERATGVTERELMDELSVTAVKGENNGVPLAVPFDDNIRAAEDGLERLMNPVTGSRFNTEAEFLAAAEAKRAEFALQHGRPLKDFNIVRQTLPGGQATYRIEGIVGKPDGFGYSSVPAAKRGAKKMGLGSAEVIEKQQMRNPLEGKDTVVFHGTGEDIVGELRESAGGKMGSGLYVTPDTKLADDYTKVVPGGPRAIHPLRVNSDKIFGLKEMQAGGYTVKGAKDAIEKLGLDLEDFIEWKTKRNIETLEDEAVDGLIDTQTFWTEVDNYIARRVVDEDVLDAAENINNRLKEMGFEGRASRMYGDEEIVVFDAKNAPSAFAQPEIIQDVSGQFFIKVTKDMPETGWYTGTLAPEKQGFLSKMIGRYIQSSARISDPLLQGRASEANAYLGRAAKVIDKEMMDIFRRLPKDSREVVGKVAERGIIYGRNYTEREFNVLVQRGFGRPAKDIERKAYADYLLVKDMDYVLHNTYQYLDGVMKGKETVTFRTKWGQEVSDDVVIDYNLNTVPMDRVYNASTNRHFVHGRNPLTTKDLERLKGQGYVMLRMPDSFVTPDGVRMNHILIKKSDLDIRPLKREQLPYSEGGHRMYTAQYFVKQGKKGVQPDTGSKYLMAPATHRTAENLAEGNRWADKMNEARIAVKEKKALTPDDIEEIFNGEPGFPTGEEFLARVADDTYDLENPFETVFDRELPSLYQTSGEDFTRLFNEDELGINGYYRTTGRMYTSHKGAEALRDTKGEFAAVLDPYDTLATSLRNVTRKLGMYNYKVNAMERFQNTYKGFMMPDPANVSLSDFLMNARPSATTSREMINKIEAQREAIKNVLRFETPGEKMASDVYRSLAESVLGDGTSAARKFAHDAIWWWKEKNPVSLMRGLAFDAKLGMFNVGQLLIQSSTMLSATALSPKWGFAGMSGLYPMHAYLLKGGSEAVLDRMVAKGTWKTMKFDSADEFKEYARHAYRHGFMHMDGSHIMINNNGPAAHFGSFAEKTEKVRDQARVFFYTAETWNRLVAYRIAWGETMAKGLRPNDEAFNLTVLKLADDYSMNMTQESAAHWQKGFLSLPTQFWAYNQRMMDAMFGSRFTLPQKLRLIAMNGAIAGSAGIPGLQALSEFVKQKYGAAPDINSLEGIADRGLIDYMNYQMTGNDILIGERIGTGGWASQTVKSLFGASEYGEVPFMDLALGASYTIGKSMAKTMVNLAKYSAAESGSDLGGNELTKDAFLQMMNEVSTFGNINKAMMINQYGLYKSNKGTIIADGLPDTNAVYSALSFRPAKADEIGYMLAWKKNKEEAIKEVAGKLRAWRQEALTTGDWEKNYKKANALIRLLPEADRREVIKRTNQITDQSFYDYVEKKVSEEQLEEKAYEEGVE